MMQRDNTRPQAAPMTTLEQRIEDARRRQQEMQKQSKPKRPTPGDTGVTITHEAAYRFDEADEARRSRTHRLVQIGALAEKYLNMQGWQPEEVEQMLMRLARSEVGK